MKIHTPHSNEVIDLESNKNHYLYTHLEPLDIFSYANGSKEKFYMKLSPRVCVMLTAPIRFFHADPNSLVVKWPDASIDVGENFLAHWAEEPTKDMERLADVEEYDDYSIEDVWGW